jgi:PKD repeat protein
MISRSILILMCIACWASAHAQKTNNEIGCATDQVMREAFARNPFLLQQRDEAEARSRAFIASGVRSGEVYTIPVVFHIIHQYGEENISNEQVQNAVDILNRDFRKLNADTADIVDAFDELAADTRIEFRLATKDPLGHCTNGIVRYASTLTDEPTTNASKLTIWPRSNYLNIWVVRSMADGVAGYAYLPFAAHGGILAWADGIIIRHNYIGAIGTGNPFRSRALTHEVGHYLNLYHPWGSNNNPGVECGDDEVADTPVTEGWSSCNLSGSVCEPGVIENVQNYMEYAFCSRMFTHGQSARMEAALNESLSGRNSLWTPENLASTGVADGTAQLCAPVADFFSSSQFVCVGNEVTFSDYSSDAQPDSWQWTFQDGIPSTGSTPQVDVEFTSPGWKTVTLTVSNAQGSSVITKEFAILVAPSWSEVAGVPSEDFSNSEEFYFHWHPVNLNANQTSFQHFTGAGFNDNQCVQLNAGEETPLSLFDLPGGDVDELVTPAYDLTNYSGASLSFAYAFATATSSAELMTDALEIWSSSNCGENWVLRKTISGMDLITAGSFGNAFVPQSSAQWLTDSWTIPSTLETDGVRFKFRFISSAFANHLYLDNIQLNGTVGLQELEANMRWSMYPNPANDQITLSFSPEMSGAREAIIRDLTGREMMRIGVPPVNGQETRMVWDISTLSRGMYAVEILGDGWKQSRPLIRN